VARKVSSKQNKKKRQSPKRGRALLKQVVALTGLQSGALHNELETLLAKKNIDSKRLTLDQLRAVVASYLREIMGGILERTAPRKSESEI